MKILNKIDLHLHIDGSVRPETVYELSRKYSIRPECTMSLEEIKKSMIIPEGEYDPDFLTFEPALRIMQNPEGCIRAAKELVERLDQEELIYAEMRFAPQYHTKQGMNQEDAVKAVIEGMKQGLQGKKIKTGIILCAMNHCDAASNHEANMETVRLAEKYLSKGVVGFDLAGYEENMSEYKDLFDLAKSKGIPCTTHSEFTVAEALKYQTKRIGHGYQAAMIKELSEQIIQNEIVLEMCPKSSLSYEYGLSLDHTHPIAVLFKKGAKITINTDNLTVLDTSLEKEYDLVRKMGLTDEDIVQMNNYAIEASFADINTKKQLLNFFAEKNFAE